nr:DNA helicase [Tanacetum cinerariifolium]
VFRDTSTSMSSTYLLLSSWFHRGHGMDMFVLMKTTRKLVPKCTPVRGDAGSVQGNVVRRDLCDDVCGVGLSASPKRQCVHQPSPVPSPDQGLLVRNLLRRHRDVDGQLLLVFVPLPCGQSLSHSMSDAGINGYLIGTGGRYDHTIHVVHTDTSSNRQLGSGSQQPTITISSESAHGVPNTNNRSRARRDRTRRDFAVTGDDLNLQPHTSGLPGSRIALCTYQIYPEYIKMLLEDRHFLENIRACNQMFSMTSLGAHTDESINNGCGPYVFKISGQLYHWIGSLCPEEGQPPKFLQLYINDTDNKYKLPTGDMLGAIVYETGPEADMDYDIILEERSGHPQRELKMIGPTSSTSEQKRLTMLAYYLYYLNDRANRYNYLSRTGRLFQQYIVTAICAIEQNRIDFIREHQNDIRNEYLSGIYDAINRGDNDGFDCGSRLILPVFHRAGVVDRVFEMKIDQFVNYLRDDQPFGKVVAVLYKVEFQKSGLPHCHTLLWIDESVQIRRNEDIDNYISAKIPSKHVDPEFYRIFLELLMHGPCGLANPSASCDLGLTNDVLIILVRTWTVDYCSTPVGGRSKMEITLQEAALTATQAELRALLAHILAFGQVSDLKRLWQRTWKSMLEDIPYVSSISLNVPGLHIDYSELEDYVPYELEACLNHCSKSLTDFGLRPPPQHLMSVLRNKLLMEEKSYDQQLLANERDLLLPNNLWDILDESNRIFGGKTVMLGGDFRQTLPVKKATTKDEIIRSSVAKSCMWPHFK